jgi:SAM-dependent methyltransferase
MNEGHAINAQLVRTYEEHWLTYIRTGKVQPPKSWWQWLDRAYVRCEPGSDTRVLEIGAGPGRDAERFRDLFGADILVTDATEAFTQHLRQKGFEAQQYNLLTDSPPGTDFDFVFAGAVLHHFTPADLLIALANIRKCLRPGGIAAFAQRRGEAEAYMPGRLGVDRYFCYRQPWQLWQATEQHLTVLEVEYQNWTAHALRCSESPGGHPRWPDEWVMVTAQREWLDFQ